MIAIGLEPNPEKVTVIRHQAVGRTENTIRKKAVTKELSHRRMVMLVEPASASPFDAHYPMDAGLALVVITLKTLEAASVDRWVVGHALYWHDPTSAKRRLGARNACAFRYGHDLMRIANPSVAKAWRLPLRTGRSAKRGDGDAKHRPEGMPPAGAL